MADGDYCTVVEVKEWIGAKTTTKDLFVQQAVTAASRSIDHYCQRTFWQAGTVSVPVARRFPSPCDNQTLLLGDFNDLVEIVTLKTDEDGDGVFETTWLASEYELLPINPTAAPAPKPYTQVRATGTTRYFPASTGVGRLERIEISGVWGWPAVPSDVAQACLIQAGRLCKRKESPEGVTGFGSEFGPIRLSTRKDPDVTDLLDPYRHYGVA